MGTMQRARRCEVISVVFYLLAAYVIGWGLVDQRLCYLQNQRKLAEAWRQYLTTEEAGRK